MSTSNTKAAVAAICLGWCSQALPAPADFILSGGHIKTPAGWAQSLAVRDGIIVAVGDAAAVEAERGSQTRIVDISGRTVLAGLSDVHVHPLGAGLTELRCKIAQGSTLAATKSAIKACASKVQPGGWVVGGQWDAPALGGVPDRKALDDVVPGQPVFLEDTSGHSAWANSRALQIAGINSHTVNPEGGIIERDKRGQPTGILRESATDWSGGMCLCLRTKSCAPRCCGL